MPPATGRSTGHIDAGPSRLKDRRVTCRSRDAGVSPGLMDRVPCRTGSASIRSAELTSIGPIQFPQGAPSRASGFAMGNLPDTTMAGQRQQRVNRGRRAVAAAGADLRFQFPGRVHGQTGWSRHCLASPSQGPVGSTQCANIAYERQAILRVTSAGRISAFVRISRNDGGFGVRAGSVVLHLFMVNLHLLRSAMERGVAWSDLYL